jgi:hypothetical protein
MVLYEITVINAMAVSLKQLTPISGEEHDRIKERFQNKTETQFTERKISL